VVGIAAITSTPNPIAVQLRRRRLFAIEKNVPNATPLSDGIAVSRENTGRIFMI
jgi:hypothetical protein